MKISLVTDELSSDPETAIELATTWGIRDFELRGYYTDRAPGFSNYQKQRLRELLAEHEARVIAIGPGLFKIPFPAEAPQRSSLSWMDLTFFEGWENDRRLLRYHLDELLPASLDYANEIGAGMVVIFGFGRGGAPPGPPPDAALECLHYAAEKAGAAGLVLALENEDGFWADTGSRTAAILRTVDHPALKANWDPGNAFFAGERPFPEGYEALRELVAHVHFKDARRNEYGEAEYVLQGEIDWQGQVQALVGGGYSGFISIETHTRPKVTGTCYLNERLATLIRAARAHFQGEIDNPESS